MDYLGVARLRNYTPDSLATLNATSVFQPGMEEPYAAACEQAARLREEHLRKAVRNCVRNGHSVSAS
jgi:hypothetical protein